MKPDGYRVKGQRQSLHLRNISVLLCLTAFSTKGSFNVRALDLSQELKGLSLCFSLRCGLMFSLHKGKTVKLSFIYSPCCISHVCFAFTFPSPDFLLEEKNEEASELMRVKKAGGILFIKKILRSCASALSAFLETCSGFVHVFSIICLLFCYLFHPLGFSRYKGKMNRNIWVKFSVSVSVGISIAVSLKTFYVGCSIKTARIFLKPIVLILERMFFSISSFESPYLQ